MYNFHVQCLVNFYTKIWRKINSNTAPATRVREERRAPRRPRPRAPLEALHPRRPFPRCARVPRPAILPRRRVLSRPRRTSERATDRRSDGGVAAVRAAIEGEEHGGIFAVMPPSPTTPSRGYLSAFLLPPLATELPPAIAAAALSSCTRSRSPPASHFPSSPRP
jgi:hypothetical protein